jgi:trk system potassium uptake protein TrkA
MRIVFIGAGTLARATTKRLLAKGHEVVIVEKDADVIETLSEEYDCSFVHGDGSRPSVLEDIDPHSTDCLFCVASEDTSNILAAVVARSMDFKKIVVRIETEELLPVCRQLQLEHVIVPDQRVARELIAFAEGQEDALRAAEREKQD